MTKEEILQRIEAKTMVEDEYQNWAKALPDLYFTTVLDLYTLWRYKQDDDVVYLTNEMVNELQIEEQELRVALEEKDEPYIPAELKLVNGPSLNVVKSPGNSIENILLLPTVLSDIEVKMGDEFLIIPYTHDTCGIVSLKGDKDNEALTYFCDRREHTLDPYVSCSIYKYSHGEVGTLRK